MTLHLGYPTVTQGHWLVGLTPVARPNRNHRSHPCSQKQTELTGLTPVAQNYPNPTLDQTQTIQTPLIMWKVHVTHDREHDCHDSLHSAEVAQLYPQVGDFIAN
jgi:hypothetical protein